MILAFNYEEVTALTYGARAYLGEPFEGESPVAAPSEARVAVEALLPRLVGDTSLRTLAEQEAMERAVRTIVEHLRNAMAVEVLATHPAAEEAVSAYFDYAHSLAVLGRLVEMGVEMRALVEVMTGCSPDTPAAREFVFPD